MNSMNGITVSTDAVKANWLDDYFASVFVSDNEDVVLMLIKLTLIFVILLICSHWRLKKFDATSMVMHLLNRMAYCLRLCIRNLLDVFIFHNHISLASGCNSRLERGMCLSKSQQAWERQSIRRHELYIVWFYWPLLVTRL